MPNEIVDKESAEAVMLDELASLAKSGVRAVVVIGKVISKRSFPARDGQAASVNCDTVVSEGKSWTLRFPESATTPGQGYEGAFIVQYAYKGKNGDVADCLAFS